MTYEKFKTAIRDEVINVLDDTYTVVLDTTTKNNNCKLDALLIKQQDINISPTIYLNYYYDLLCDGAEIEELVEMILEVYNSHKKSENLDMDFFTDFEKVKDRIVFKLINRELNKELLKNIPYVEYLDMAIVFYYFMSEINDDESLGSILIKNDFVTKWNVSVETLMEIAMINTPEIMGLEIKSLQDTVVEIMGSAMAQDILEDSKGMVPFFVISNKYKINGACTLIYKNMLEGLAGRLKTDLYIIPCSVHEIIVIPAIDDEYDNVQSLKDTISYVNRNEVRNQDILSDNLYYYSMQNQALNIC